MSGNFTLESLNKDTGTLRAQQDVLNGAVNTLLLVMSGVYVLSKFAIFLGVQIAFQKYLTVIFNGMVCYSFVYA